MARAGAKVTTAAVAAVLLAVALLAAGPQLAHLEVARCLPAAAGGCGGTPVLMAPGGTGSASAGSRTGAGAPCLQDASCAGSTTSALSALAAGLGAAVVVAAGAAVVLVARRAARRGRQADPGRRLAGGLFRPPRLLPA